MRKFFITLLFFGGASIKNSSIAQQKVAKPIADTEQENNIGLLQPICVKAMTSSVSERDTVEATIKDRHYILYPNGRIAVRLATSSRTNTFHLNTKRLVETAYFFLFQA